MENLQLHGGGWRWKWEREVWETERREAEREDVHIWSCSMALTTGGGSANMRPPLDLLDKEDRRGVDGKQEGSDADSQLCHKVHEL